MNGVFVSNIKFINSLSHIRRRRPSKLCFLIHHDTHDHTVKIWSSFLNLYRFVTLEIHEFSNIEDIFKKCKGWVNEFLALRSLRSDISSEMLAFLAALCFKNYITPILVRTFGVVSLITLAVLWCSILFRTFKASTVASHFFVFEWWFFLYHHWSREKLLDLLKKKRQWFCCYFLRPHVRNRSVVKSNYELFFILYCYFL
jgi:hypothetical protein